MNARAPAHILVIKLGALGDFIQALGPMAAIRAAHPDARITLLTTAPYRTLAQACGYFDSVTIDHKPRWSDITGWLNLRKTLNAGEFTRVYDLQNNDRTALYFHLFSNRPEWVGAARGASHRNASPERTRGKAFDGHVQTLALAGIKNVGVDTLAWMTGENDFKELHKPYALIVPGASPKHPYKRWPEQNYALLSKRLIAEKKILPVLIGAESEKELSFTIEKEAPGVLNLTGLTSLFDLPGLARNALAAIGNDTGPMHLIAPTECKTIVLFSEKTDPSRHAPLGANVHSLQKENLQNLDVDTVWKVLDV